jgi:hypothetical protein
MDQEYYAHSLPEKPQKDWQRLEEHLQAVAEKARSFGVWVRGTVPGFTD